MSQAAAPHPLIWPRMKAAPSQAAGNRAAGRVFPSSPHLSVDGPDDGGLEPHPRHKADVEVLVQDQRLQAGREEEEAGVEEAMPGGGAFVIDEVNEQPRKEEEALEEGTTGRALGLAGPDLLLLFPSHPEAGRLQGAENLLRQKQTHLQGSKQQRKSNRKQLPIHDIKGQRGL